MRSCCLHRRVIRRKAPTALPSTLRPRNVRAKGGVYVPSDSFGGQSPERKAAGIMRTFFTFVAARVVLAQLEGSGRGALGAYDSKAATDLHHFLQNVPLKDGDEWLAQLMRRNSSLGLRLMEVRDHYCEEAFEWDHLQRIANKDMKTANTKLMRQFAAASLAASMAEAKAEGAEAEASASATPASAAAAVVAVAGAGDGAGTATLANSSAAAVPSAAVDSESPGEEGQSAPGDNVSRVPARQGEIVGTIDGSTGSGAAGQAGSGGSGQGALGTEEAGGEGAGDKSAAL